MEDKLGRLIRLLEELRRATAIESYKITKVSRTKVHYYIVQGGKEIHKTQRIVNEEAIS